MKIGVIGAEPSVARWPGSGRLSGKTASRAMIPDRYRQWVFVAFMTLFMSIAVSGVTTVWNGYVGSFLTAWPAAFVRAYIIVVPAVVIAAPLSRRLTALIVREPDVER